PTARAWASCPAPRSAAAAASAPSPSRSARTTRAPSSQKRRAVASPIPLAAPVTSARAPSRALPPGGGKRAPEPARPVRVAGDEVTHLVGGHRVEAEARDRPADAPPVDVRHHAGPIDDRPG